MNYSTTVSKTEALDHIGAPELGEHGARRARGPQGDGREVAPTPEMRRACVAIARARLFSSFPGSGLCPITVAEFTEYSEHDLTAARVVLTVGANYTADEALGESVDR